MVLWLNIRIFRSEVVRHVTLVNLTHSIIRLILNRKNLVAPQCNGPRLARHIECDWWWRIMVELKCKRIEQYFDHTLILHQLPDSLADF